MRITGKIFNRSTNVALAGNGLGLREVGDLTHKCKYEKQ